MTVGAAAKRPVFTARWWRACVAWCALVALAWPSLGPLPWLVHDFADHLPGAYVHSHAEADHDDDHHAGALSIPGSPTHPADHNCPECEVLKHLSRCVLPILAIAVCAPVVVSFVARDVAFSRPFAPAPAHRPPARAPPPATV